MLLAGVAAVPDNMRREPPGGSSQECSNFRVGSHPDRNQQVGFNIYLGLPTGPFYSELGGNSE